MGFVTTAVMEIAATVIVTWEETAEGMEMGIAADRAEEATDN
jgi:hypothetical protein